MNFKEWIGNTRVVSFDFDSTLTKPHWSDSDELWVAADPREEDAPNWDNIALMRKFAEQGFEIIIVTSRSEGQRGEVGEFVKKYKLPVKEIICTNGRDKGPILQQLGVEAHHDDLEQQHEDPQMVFKGKWVKVYHPMDDYDRV